MAPDYFGLNFDDQSFSPMNYFNNFNSFETSTSNSRTTSRSKEALEKIEKIKKEAHAAAIKKVNAAIDKEIKKSNLELTKLDEQLAVLTNNSSTADEKQEVVTSMKSFQPKSTAKLEESSPKLGFWGGAKNILKGAWKSAKGMFIAEDENGKVSVGKSILRTLKTVAITGVAVAACAAIEVGTGFTATPLILAGIGAVMGAGQIAKGASEVSDAKTKEEAEAGWQDVGGGSFGVALSAVGGKAAYGAKAARGVKVAAELADDAAQFGEAGDAALNMIKTGRGSKVKAGLEDLADLSKNKPEYTEFNAKINTKLQGNKIGGLNSKTQPEVKVSDGIKTESGEFATNAKRPLIEKNNQLKQENESFLDADKKVLDAHKTAYNKNIAEIAKNDESIKNIEAMVENLGKSTDRNSTLASLKEAKKLIAELNKDGKYNELEVAISKATRELNAQSRFGTTFTRENLVETSKSAYNTTKDAIKDTDWKILAGEGLVAVSPSATYDYATTQEAQVAKKAETKETILKIEAGKKDQYIIKIDRLIKKAELNEIELDVDEDLDIAKMDSKELEKLYNKIQKQVNDDSRLAKVA